MTRRGDPPPRKDRKDLKSIREEVEWAFNHKGGGRWLVSLADDPKTLPLFVTLLNKVIPAAVDISANVNVIDLGLALEQASKRMLDVSPNTLTPDTIEHVPDTLTQPTLEQDEPDTPDTLEGESFEVLG